MKTLQEQLRDKASPMYFTVRSKAADKIDELTRERDELRAKLAQAPAIDERAEFEKWWMSENWISDREIQLARNKGNDQFYDAMHVQRAWHIWQARAKLAQAQSCVEQPAPHPDDIAVDKFAAAMKTKMAKQRAKGYGGWDDPQQCTVERLQTMLADHIGKGDPVDVGNFAMMLFNRDAQTAQQPASDESVVGVVTCFIGETFEAKILNANALEIETKLYTRPQPAKVTPERAKCAVCGNTLSLECCDKSKGEK